MSELSISQKAEIEASFAKQGLMRTFGAGLDSVEYGKTIISMPFTEAVSQQHQFFHGGTIGSLADTACGYAAISVVAQGDAALTAEFKMNFLAPADGDLSGAGPDG